VQPADHLGANPANKNATARTLDVLERIVADGHAPTHAELARSTCVPKSTLTLILAELQALGYVRLSQRRFVPGPALVGFGHRLQARNRADGIRPTLEALATASGEGAMFAIEMWPHIVLIDHVQAPRPIRYVAEVGSLRPMHCTALGRALLAFTDRGARDLPPETLTKLTSASRVDPDEIDAELARTRERGYALNVGESLDDVGSIAAPVLDQRGWPVGAIAISWLQYRVKDPEERFWPMLAAAISALRDD
jgi:IclR family transcriptional regulator, acetate operon repressor